MYHLHRCSGRATVIRAAVAALLAWAQGPLALAAVPATTATASAVASASAQSVPTAAVALPARDTWGYRPVTPARLLDTRPGEPTVDGLFAGSGVVRSGARVTFDVGGRAGLPPADQIEAVVVNVTGIAPSAATYLTALPAAYPAVDHSTLNLDVGEVAANLAIISLWPENRRVSVFNARGETHVAVDVVGYFRLSLAREYNGDGSGARMLDTRLSGQTFDGLQVGMGKLGPGGTFKVLFNHRLQSQDVNPGDLVALNVTGIWPSKSTYLTVFQGGTSRPGTSSLNLPPARNIANLVFAKVGADSSVAIFNAQGSLDVAVDFVGRIVPGANLQALNKPFRLTDTRAGQPTGDGIDSGAGAIAAGGVHRTPVTGRGSPVIEAGATAVAVNVTAVAPTANTFLSAYPAGMPRPGTSTVNLPAGAVRPNAAVVPIGTGGAINVYNAQGRTDLVVDAYARVLPSDPRIVGLVRNQAHLPIASATVTATNVYLGPTPVVVSTTTSSNGQYDLALPAPGLWQVCAQVTGGPLQCAGGWLGGSESPHNNDIYSRSRATFNFDLLPYPGGVVRSVDGAPLAGVTVRLRESSGSTTDLATAVTRADGSWDLLSYPVSYPVCVFFDASAATGGSSTTGYVSAYWPNPATPWDCRVNLRYGVRLTMSLAAR